MRVLGRAISEGPVRCTTYEPMMPYKYLDATLCQFSGAFDVAMRACICHVTTFFAISDLEQKAVIFACVIKGI